MTPALGRDLGHGMQCDLDLIRNIYLNSSNGVLGESQLFPLCLIGNETWEQVGKPRRATCQDEKGKTRQDGLDEGSGHYSSKAGAGKILPSHPQYKSVHVPALPDGEDYHKEREWNPCNEVCFWRSVVKN